MEQFFKYHGLGNDFVVLDRRSTGVDLDAAQAIALCDRRRGIGADGVLVVLPEKGAAGRMVVHNADGSVAEMCGNGLRCVVKHLVEHDEKHPRSITVATGAGLLESEVDYDGTRAKRITVSMGPARLTDRHIPKAPFAEGTLTGTPVSMGNPHLVLLDTPPAKAAALGPALETHRLFPERTNVEFCAPRQEGGLTVTVWERGVGITDACGTGACAAVVAHALAGRVEFDQWIPVQLPGGLLEIKAKADLSQVWLRGPATFVYQGDLPPL